MIPRITFFIAMALSLIVLISVNLQAQSTPDKHIDQDTKDPIEITSDRMRSESNGDKIIFSGNVLGRWGDLGIISDILEIYNSQNPSKAQEIVAIGNVTITRGPKKAKGDRAVYMDQSQKIIMTGKPKAVAWEGKNKIEGREMIFLLDKDRFVVNDRVRMKIYPSKNKKTPRQRKNVTSKPQTKISPKK